MKEYLTKQEIMDYFQIKDDTLRKWQKEGLVTCDMGGRKFFFKKEDIVEFMDSKRFRYEVR